HDVPPPRPRAREQTDLRPPARERPAVGCRAASHPRRAVGAVDPDERERACARELLRAGEAEARLVLVYDQQARRLVALGVPCLGIDLDPSRGEGRQGWSAVDAENAVDPLVPELRA